MYQAFASSTFSNTRNAMRPAAWPLNSLHRSIRERSKRSNRRYGTSRAQPVVKKKQPDGKSVRLYPSSAIYVLA
jgi:hypothetical protein